MKNSKRLSFFSIGAMNKKLENLSWTLAEKDYLDLYIKMKKLNKSLEPFTPYRKETNNIPAEWIKFTIDSLYSFFLAEQCFERDKRKLHSL